MIIIEKKGIGTAPKVDFFHYYKMKYFPYINSIKLELWNNVMLSIISPHQPTVRHFLSFSPLYLISLVS